MTAPQSRTRRRACHDSRWRILGPQPGTEGAFLACSFWLADNYALTGRLKEAEELFLRLLGLSNHLGLLSEEDDPRLPVGSATSCRRSRTWR